MTVQSLMTAPADDADALREDPPGRLPAASVRTAARTAGLRPHQKDALSGVAACWELSARTQVRAACGTGKTRVGVAAVAGLAAAGTPVIAVVAVPTLALVAQTLREYREFLPSARLLAICSDPSVATGLAEVGDETGLVDDEVTAAELAHLESIGIDVGLSATRIAEFLTTPVRPASRRDPAGTGVSVLVVTHVSAPVLQEAQRLSGVSIDVLIVDEAHRTAGSIVSAPRTALINHPIGAGIGARRRLFMTATPRVHRTGVSEAALIASMDDETLFGPVAFDLPFQQAVDSGLLAPYTVAVVAVTDEQWQALAGIDPTVQTAGAAKVTPLVTAKALNGRITMDPATLAATSALLRSMHVHGLRTVVSFHSRVWRSRVFADAVSVISQATGRPVDCHAVSAGSTPTAREAALAALRDPSDRPVLVSNARVLSEGVDVPALDAVLFADPRRSTVDVTQVVGRVMRTAPGKERGVIILPVVLPSDALALDAESVVTSSSFAPVWTLLRALADLDVSLAARFDDARLTLARGGETDVPLLPPQVTFDIPNGLPAAFMRAFTLKAVTSVSTSWADGFAAMETFAAEHGHCRVVAKTVVDGRKLDIWVSEQRTRYALGLMRADRIAKLEALPGWYWRVREEVWSETFEVLRAFVDRHGRLPVQTEAWQGRQLGAWIGTQRLAFKRNRLPSQWRELLEALPGWSWSPHDDAWEQNFACLRVYADQFGAATPPPAYVTDDGVALGRWVYLTRNKRQRLDAVRQARLESVPGWSWDPFRDRWEAAFEQLTAFVAEHGSARVPMVKSRRREPGFNLGSWVSRQRSEYRLGKLPPADVARLEALPGWSWDPFRDQWEEMFGVLAGYAATHGAASVPGSLKTPSGRSVASWVTRMRGMYRDGDLPGEQAERLAALPGWVWDVSAPSVHRSGRRVRPGVSGGRADR